MIYLFDAFRLALKFYHFEDVSWANWSTYNINCFIVFFVLSQILFNAQIYCAEPEACYFTCILYNLNITVCCWSWWGNLENFFVPNCQHLETRYLVYTKPAQKVCLCIRWYDQYPWLVYYFYMRNDTYTLANSPKRR